MIADPLPEPWLSTMAALASLLERDADLSERDRQLTPALTAALVDHRLYRLWVPRTLDGEELPLPLSLALFEATSRLDGSFGWAVTIGTGGGLFAAQLEPAFAREIFEPPDALIAGSGTASGVATAVPGGYRVSGRWAYASGSQSAT